MRVALIASVRSVTVPSVSNQESPMDIQDLLQHLPTRPGSRHQDDQGGLLPLGPAAGGLNCFEPGQAQQVHTQRGSRQILFVVSGKARFILGDSIRDAGRGT